MVLLKPGRNAVFIYTSLLTAFILFIFLQLKEFVALQGFNPSDDGTILAQAYRLLHGEIPHLDFISLRPTLSALLHSIALLLPFPSVQSSRWIVLIEYSITASCFSFLFLQYLNIEKLKYQMILHFSFNLILFWTCGIAIISFPWTTIDGVMFSGIGLTFILNDKGNLSKYLLGLTFLALAALCRQTFAAIFIAGFFLALSRLTQQKNWLKSSLILLTSTFPFVLYLLVLMVNGAVSNFITQMSGQTTFMEIAIFKYQDMFSDGMLSMPAVYVILVLSPLIFILNKFKTTQYQYHIQRGIGAFFISLSIYLGVKMTSADIETIGLIGYDLFWANIAFGIITLIDKGRNELSLFYWFVILIAWVSSLSIGVNAHYFSFGLLLLNLACFSSRYFSDIIEKKFKFSLTTSILIASIVFSYSIYSNKTNYNYRDLAQSELTTDLSMFPAFGNIKTNENNRQYYQELKSILDEYDDIKDHFVLIPNNAIIYPVYESRNPMPLDWIQPAEYLGQEELIETEVKHLITNDKTYFILEKINAKKLFICKCPANHSDYKYINIIKNTGTLIQETEFFDVYVSP